MKHEEVYYTCNGCGDRLPNDRTIVTVTNTDDAAIEPVHEYDLCATCWLKVYAIVDAVAITRRKREDSVVRTRTRFGLGDDYDPWND